MLRPSSLSALLSTLVATSDTNSLRPHTALLALPDSAEVYAFSSVWHASHSVDQSTLASSSSLAGGSANPSRNSDLHSSSATSSSWSIGGGEASSSHLSDSDADSLSKALKLLRGLMVKHSSSSSWDSAPSQQEDDALSPTSHPSAPQSGSAGDGHIAHLLVGEERIQALAAVGTMAWREEMDRIHAFLRGKMSRSASGSTAAGSSSGRAGRGRTSTGVGVAGSGGGKGASAAGRGGERDRNAYDPDMAVPSPEDPYTVSGPSLEPKQKVAIPGTSLVRLLPADSSRKGQEAGAGGLVPLLLDCEVS